MEKSIQEMVEKIKKEMFSSIDLYHFVSASAYDTAWLAMIPDPENPTHPMFPKCLEWTINNQKELGFWGEPNHSNQPTIECIPSTLACLIALKKWDVGQENIHKGLDFIHANTEWVLLELNGSNPQWFAVVFPGMLECGRKEGLELFPEGLPEPVKSIFDERLTVLEMGKSPNHAYHPPLLFYLEALPPTFQVDCDEIHRHLSGDGSLFQSPSATASAFMLTKSKECQQYLESMVQRCGFGGVPPVYPIDEDLIKLSMADRLERLGLDEHFQEEIKDLLSDVYRNWIERNVEPTMEHLILQIYKDSLAYRLLTMHGYRVSPSTFSSFVDNEDSKALSMKQNINSFISTMLNIYRASGFIFTKKNDADKLKLSTKTILENCLKRKEKMIMASNLLKEVEYELRVPWLARMDHLEHRECIERGEINHMWAGKASYLRLSCLNDAMLLKLAKENYNYRQSIYRRELEGLKRWTRECGISSIGFGRVKTAYCYFALATTTYHAGMSAVRITGAKSGILLTIIDDFFDDFGSMDELISFTDAVERWNGEGLHKHGKVLFNALDGWVTDTARQALHIQGRDITNHLRDIWCQVIRSWLKEAEWGKTHYRPSMREYLKVASISVAVQTSVLPSMYMVGPTISEDLTHHRHYQMIIELVMLSCRLLNDLQTYEKEREEGMPNLVLQLMQRNPSGKIEDVCSYITKILDQKKHELLEHVLMDDMNCVPRDCRKVHLNNLKLFQMFYNSKNAFDPATELVQSINEAIYEPLAM